MAFNLNGMDQLLKKLEKIGSDSENIKNEALDAGAEHFRRKISENTKRSNKPGKHAADNVVIDKSGDKREIGYHKDHFYMMFQEFGTSTQSADPTVGPVFENEKEQAQASMAGVIKKRLGL